MKRHPLTLLSLLAALVAGTCVPALLTRDATPLYAQPVPRLPDFPTLSRLPVFDVRQKGAKGDGVANDSASVQAALNAAGTAGGGVVSVPSGNWLLSGSTITVPANVHVVGVGYKTNLIANAGRSTPLFRIDSHADVSFENLRFTKASGAALSSTAYAIYAVGPSDNLLVQDVTTDGYVHGVHVAGDASGSATNASFTLKISGDSTSGAFRLGFINPTALGEAIWTGDIAWNATVAAVQTAVNTAAGSGNFNVDGSNLPAGTLTLDAAGTFAGLYVPTPLFARGTLAGGASNGAIVTPTVLGGGPFVRNVTLRRARVLNSPNDWGMEFDCVDGLKLENVVSWGHYFDGAKFRKHCRGIHLSDVDFSYNGKGWFTNPATAAGDGFDSYAGGEEIDGVNVRCRYNAGNGFTIKNDTGSALSGYASGKYGLTRKINLSNVDASYNMSNGANVTTSSGSSSYAVTDVDLNGRFEGNGVYGIFIEAVRARVSGLARRNGSRGCVISPKSIGVDVTDLRAPANGNGAGTGYGLYIEGKNVTVKGGSYSGQDADGILYTTDTTGLVKHHNANIQIAATASDVRIERTVVAPEGTNSTGRSIQVASGATNVFIETSGTLTPGSNLLYGSPGSTYLKTDTGALYRKTTGAVDAVGTWRQQANALSVVSATIDFPSINGGSSNTQSVTVTGAEVGDPVLVTAPVGFDSRLNLYGVVTSAGNVGVVAYNPTAGAIDAASGSFAVLDFKN